MKEERKTYSKEFKQKAVELGNVRGNVQEIARELGIRAELIYRWRRERDILKKAVSIFSVSDRKSTGS